MKLKFLSLFLAFGLFAMGTTSNAEAAEHKLDGSVKAAGDSSSFCNWPADPFCTDGPSPNSAVCTGICSAYGVLHALVLNTILLDPNLKSSEYQSCVNLRGSGPTLSDLSCCLKNGNPTSATTTAIGGVCYAIKSEFCVAPGGVSNPLGNYAQYLCCPQDSGDIKNCMSKAGLSCDGFTPNPPCPDLPTEKRKAKEAPKK